jgi:hypothetical protein
MEQEKLSRFDWFGIISGIIGLIADVISLSTLFIVSKGNQDSQNQTNSGISFGVWIASFLMILYTILIASFYSRRLFAMKHKAKNINLDAYRKGMIEKGARGFTYIFGFPFMQAYMIALLFALTSLIPPSPIRDEKVAAIMIFVGGLSMGLSFLVCYLINEQAEKMYAAFDPD